MTGRSSSLTQMVSINDHEHARPSNHIADIYRRRQIKMDGTQALHKEVALGRRAAVKPAAHYFCQTENETDSSGSVPGFSDDTQLFLLCTRKRTVPPSLFRFINPVFLHLCLTVTPPRLLRFPGGRRDDRRRGRGGNRRHAVAQEAHPSQSEQSYLQPPPAPLEALAHASWQRGRRGGRCGPR